MPDRAGSTLDSARRFRIRDTVRTFRESVGPGDRLDIYRFRIRNSSTFRAELSIQNFDQANASIKILDRDGTIIQGFNERFFSSDLDDSPIRLIRFGQRANPNDTTKDPLQPGVYYLRIRWLRNPRRRQADYELDVSATDFVPDGGGSANPGGGPDETPASNNALNSARRFRIRNTVRTFEDAVGRRNRQDLYRFRISEDSTFRAELSIQNFDRANASIQILDSNGTVQTGFNERFFSTDPDESPIRLIRYGQRANPNDTTRDPLTPGVYYLRVKWLRNPRRIRANYELSVSAVEFVPDEGVDDGNGGDNGGDSPVLGRAALVEDINDGELDSSPRFLTEFNNTLYFSAVDEDNGRELWRLDGDNAVLVEDINDGLGSSNPSFLTEFDGTLYFAANDGEDGQELWRLDGQGNPEQVDDIFDGSIGSNPEWLTVVDNTLFFAATDEDDGRELWRLQAGENNAQQVADIFDGEFGSSPSWLVNFNGTLYFNALSDDGDGFELWRSDGTRGGTDQVEDIFDGIDSSFPQFLTVVDNTLFFAATDEDEGRELWQLQRNSNDQDVVTQVSDINSGLDSSDPTFLAEFNGRVYFSANDGDDGRELWRSDGTNEGTELVADIDNNGSSDPFYLLGTRNRLFFAANDGDIGRELWQSNGTTEGTSLAANIFPESSTGGTFSGFQSLGDIFIGDIVNRFAFVNGTLFFGATGDFDEGEELWSFSPTNQ